jgi:N-acetylmuramoyl-L-alanine amidase
MGRSVVGALVVAGMVLVFAGGARAADTAAPPPLLEGVEVLQGPAPAVRLRLSAPAPLHAETLAPAGGAPHRIYVDLAGTRLGPQARGVIAGAGPLLRVRIGQFDASTTRVVLDLGRRLPFAIRDEGHTVTVALEPPPPAAPAPPPAAAIPPAAAAAPPVEPQVQPQPQPPVPPAAPPPVRSPVPPPLARRFPIIVLDPGHGGHDPGAEGVGGVLEKDVVLEVAQRLAIRLLARLPVAVVMTRVDDSFLPIDGRLAMTEDATLFLSLHANASEYLSARGLELFYGGGAVRTASADGMSAQARLLGRCLDRALRTRVGPLRRNAEPAGFGVLTRNPAPSALVEIGYLTHRGDAARAQASEYQELLADALVDGVAAFLRASAPQL